MDKSELPVVDLNKIMDELKLPNIDLQAIIEGRRKDLEAIVKANEVALNGIKSVADKQAEMLQTVLGEIGTKLKSMAQDGNPSANATEMAQQTIEKALGAMRTLAEANGQSQAQVLDVISTRVQQSIDEIRANLRPADEIRLSSKNDNSSRAARVAACGV
jgi:phasin family protein